jgi:uncharacterized protein YbjT (DUF2867 family)
MIVVTAPTGDIGHQVLANLLERGASIRVIARDPSGIPEQMRKRVEVVHGSHGDIDIVNRAFAGADAVFWLCPPDSKAKSVEAAYVDFTRPACEAFKSKGVKRVVCIAPLGRESPAGKHAGHVTASLAMDDLIMSTGVAFRALTMPSFMDNILMQLQPITTKGVFFSPIDGDRKLPACATRDIAASAAKLLLDAFWSGQGHLAVLGPEDLSFNDMAQIMTEVLGKPIHFLRITFEAYKARFIELGMSEAMAQGMTDMARAKNEGIDNAEPRTPGNTTPTTFRQWCEEKLKPALRAGSNASAESTAA